MRVQARATPPSRKKQRLVRCVSALGLAVLTSPSWAGQYTCLRGALGGLTVSAISEGAAKRKVAALRGWKPEEVKCSPLTSSQPAPSSEPRFNSRFLPRDLMKIGACQLDGDHLGLKPCTEYRSRADNTLWRLVTDRNSGSLDEIHFRKETHWIRWAALGLYDHARYMSPEAKAYVTGGSVNPRAYLETPLGGTAQKRSGRGLQ